MDKKFALLYSTSMLNQTNSFKQHFSVTEIYINTKFRCSLGDQSGLFKAYTSKRGTRRKDRVERLERIELLHQQPSAKILIKHSAKNKYILVSWSREVSSKKLARVSVS